MSTVTDQNYRRRTYRSLLLTVVSRDKEKSGTYGAPKLMVTELMESLDHLKVKITVIFFILDAPF